MLFVLEALGLPLCTLVSLTQNLWDLALSIIASIIRFNNIFFPENFKLIHLESPVHSMLPFTQYP